jgi:hypothetical protein
MGQYSMQITPLSGSVFGANQQTQLLEKDHGKWLDTRTQGKTIASNPAVETLGTINRTTYGARKKKVSDAGV